MNKLIVEAYARQQAGFGPLPALEEYLCKSFNLPIGILNEKYQEITAHLNQEHNYKTNEEFQELIYLEYIKFFTELEEEIK